MSIKAIGFANKFYTLWYIDEEIKSLGNGRSYIVTHYTYVKNISMDKATAIAKYPGVKLNENLRGVTASWDSKPKEIWDNIDTFRFGKYSYEKIADNTDTKYIEWYWNQIDGEHKDFVEDILKSRGYEVRTWNDGCKYLMSPEALENEIRENAEMKQTLKDFMSGESVELFIEYNPDMDGYYRVGNVLYHFPEVRENYYNGFLYYLPVLNGKQKRIKNKTIIIKDYKYTINNGNLNVEIFDFEIKK